MHDLRAVKSELELDLIKKPAALQTIRFAACWALSNPGYGNLRLRPKFTTSLSRNRSKGPAFETIVASGADSCTLHYVKNDKQCRAGDLVLIDFGAEYANYAADVTRTVPVSGKFSKRQKQVYNAVLNVQKAAIKLLVPGSTLDEYHKEVGQIMESELIRLGLLDPKLVKKQSEDDPLYKKYFPHGTSHYLGLDVHDYGDKYRPFEPGMVLTCEPGIYIQRRSDRHQDRKRYPDHRRRAGRFDGRYTQGG